MKKVIVAPLCWGLGHASRCIPLIKALLAQGFTPILASDGPALTLLEKEFPALETITLPSYAISYGKQLKSSLFRSIPRVLKAVKAERKCIATYLKTHNDVVGILSDNRFGVYNPQVPSVYITHQLNVHSGNTTLLTSYVHQNIIKKFDECWIPDDEGSPYSGALSVAPKGHLTKKYIGVLSRFSQQTNHETPYDICVVLSGPEPHRTQLETHLLTLLSATNYTVLFIQGKIETQQTKTHKGTIQVVNFMLSEELEDALHHSNLVICRAGYSSIMDLLVLGKRALLIPTPQQTEQEYLANHFSEQFNTAVVHQNDLSLEVIEKAFASPVFVRRGKPSYPHLFRLFEGK